MTTTEHEFVEWPKAAIASLAERDCCFACGRYRGHQIHRLDRDAPAAIAWVGCPHCHAQASWWAEGKVCRNIDCEPISDPRAAQREDLTNRLRADVARVKASEQAALPDRVCLKRVERDGHMTWMESSGGDGEPEYVLASTASALAALKPHDVFLLLDEFENAQEANYHIGKKRQLAEFIAARWDRKGES